MSKMSTPLFLLILSFVGSFVASSSFPSVVTTSCGPIQGELLQGTNCVQFLGIPFAAAPVDTLRWQPPQKLVPSTHFGGRCWPESIYNATYARAPCVQAGGAGKVIGSEDCLHLEVFVPESASPSSNSLLPVFFWVHGGASIGGQASYNGDYGSPRTFAAKNDVVVVSVDYRLAMFGFLALEELNAIDLRKQNVSGNYGILDILMALEWVQDEISHFGGDPDDVTIFGQSAGGLLVLAVSVATPALSSSRRLFKNVISMSGPPRLHHTLEEGMQIHRDHFVKATSCAGSPRGTPLLNCLYGLSAEEIVEAFDTTPFWFPPMMFGLPVPPCEYYPLEIVDGVTMEHSLLESFRRGHFVRGGGEENKGTTKYVFGMMREEIDSEPFTVVTKFDESEFSSFVAEKFDKFHQGMGKFVLDLYPNHAFESQQQCYDQIAADLRVLCGNLALARAAALWERSDVFVYLCPQKPTPFLDPYVTKEKYWVRYAFHGFDAVAAFQNSPFWVEAMKKKDNEFGDYVRDQLLHLDEWEPFGLEERVHILELKEKGKMGKDEEEYVVNPRLEKCAFWDSVEICPACDWIN